MSWVNWVLTSNRLDRLPEPLLSRCTVISLEALSVRDLIGFAEQTGKSRGLSDASVDAIMEALSVVGRATSRKPNLRTVTRMLERANHLEHKPMVM